MIAKTELSNCSSIRKFYVKRKQMREEIINDNASIFAPSQATELHNLALIDDLKKYQTLTTAIDNTITINSNHEEATSVMEKSQPLQKSEFLPKLNLTLESKLFRSNNQAKSMQLKLKDKAISLHHGADPYYLKLQKTMPKRVNKKFSQYKQGWIDYCQRRKEKSLIERSLQRAAHSIQQINFDASKRKNTTQLSEMLRNNIAEKTFIFPGKLRPEIEGLKGKGGKVVPIFSEVYMIEEVYKYDRGNEETGN